VKREFRGGAKPTTLTAGITAAATTFTIADPAGWPTGTEGPFVVTIDTSQAQEEKILCSSRTGSTITVTSRGWDDTAAATHDAGAAVAHTISATDLREANTLVHLADSKGDLVVASAADTWTRLPVGANDQILVADSTQSTGVKWAARDTLTTLSDTAWTAYTPTWSSAANPQPAIGNGTLTGAWKKIGRTVHFRIAATFGGTTTYGTSVWQFTLPTACVSTVSLTPGIQVYAQAAGSNYFYGQAVTITQPPGTLLSALLGLKDAAGTITPATLAANTFTWASGDLVVIAGTYEAAS
jgi:hypothetical protein